MLGTTPSRLGLLGQPNCSPLRVGHRARYAIASKAISQVLGNSLFSPLAHSCQSSHNKTNRALPVRPSVRPSISSDQSQPRWPDLIVSPHHVPVPCTHPPIAGPAHSPQFKSQLAPESGLEVRRTKSKTPSSARAAAGGPASKLWDD